MMTCRPAGTPLEKGKKVEENGDDAPMEKERYQRLVEKLIYLSLTRPDIAYLITVTSQHMHSPTQRHMRNVHHVLRYLKETPGKGLMFKKTEKKGN